MIYYVELLVLAALWGASFLFMRTASPEFGPVMLIFFRAGIAALFLLPLLAIRQRAELAKLWQARKTLIVLGLTNTAFPFCFFAFATLSMEAGITATINSTAPMFGALIAFVWLKDKLSIPAVIGLIIGFSGVYILMLDKFNTDGSYWLSALVAMSASALYGFAACYSRLYASELKPLTIAMGSQLYATLFLLIPAWLLRPDVIPQLSAWIDVTLLGVACTGIAYVLYFRILSTHGITKALSVTYLIPLFAFIWGWLLLDESVTLNILVGAIVILIGVALTTNLIKLKPKLAN